MLPSETSSASLLAHEEFLFMFLSTPARVDDPFSVEEPCGIRNLTMRLMNDRGVTILLPTAMSIPD